MTPKQQRFVREYLIDLNATQAAIRAGYKTANADVTGPRLLGNVGVAAAIAAGQDLMADKAQFTAQDILRDLEEMRLQALACLQFSPAMKAAELRGKQIGMFVDRVVVKNTQYVVHAPMPAESPDQWLDAYAIAPDPQRIN